MCGWCTKLHLAIHPCFDYALDPFVFGACRFKLLSVTCDFIRTNDASRVSELRSQLKEQVQIVTRKKTRDHLACDLTMQHIYIYIQHINTTHIHPPHFSLKPGPSLKAQRLAWQYSRGDSGTSIVRWLQ